MPRKQRDPKTRRDRPLTDAWRYTLMTYELSEDRLDGWVDQSLNDYVYSPLGFDYNDCGDALWAQYGDQLIAEAAAYGFTPAWEAGEAPKGEGFDRWRREFLKMRANYGAGPDKEGPE